MPDAVYSAYKNLAGLGYNEIQTWYDKQQHASYQYAILFLYK